MAPIRVGLVGLSTNTTPMRPGAWAAIAHLPFILSSPDYQLVALANSSVEAAKRSIEFHQLPSVTKAYGNIEDLARDPDVDLVVVSVTVRKRQELVKPALLAGKDVFVEWPLGASSQEAREFARLAEAHKSKTIVGLQARANPLVLKIKEIVASGTIGTIISSSVLGTLNPFTTEAWPQEAQYYLDMESGANAFTIMFGHFLDTFTDILGDFENIHSLLKRQYPTIDLLDEKGTVVQAAYQKTAPDHISVHGVLKSGAVASLSLRSVPSSVDRTGVRWLISGTKGEIEVTAPEIGWQVRSVQATLSVRVGQNEEIEQVDVPEDPTTAAVPSIGSNTAGLYDAFAKGDKSRYADFDDAVRTLGVLDRIVQSSKSV